MECPFLCGYHTSDEGQAEYQLTSHIELLHTPESLFTVEDEDLKLALALQREEEQTLAAATTSREQVSKSRTTLPDHPEEGATSHAASSIDDDFPYVECPECEEFVHIVEFDDHINTHLSLKNSSNAIVSEVSECDSGYESDLRQPLPTSYQAASNSGHKGPSPGQIPPQSTTIARTVVSYPDQPSGKENVNRSVKRESRGARLGVSTGYGPTVFMSLHTPSMTEDYTETRARSLCL